MKLIVKRSKKGFTLVELLAVISILAIISLIAIGAYNGVSSRAKQKAYTSKVEQIKTSATKWAKENNVDKTTVISVNKLVVEGYLTADEVADNGLAKIVNPTDNKNMICNTVRISYKNGEILTNFDANTQNCTLANQAIDDTKIKVVAYAKDTNAKLNTNSNNVLPWTNKDLTLVVSSDTYIDQSHESEKNPIIKASYDYNGNTVDKDVIVLDKNKSNIYTGKSYLSDPNTYYNAINIDASVIYNGNIVITYHFKDGSTKSKTVNVRIDKEEATASVIANAEWITSNQKVIVKADDGNGSGAKKLYIGTGSAYNSPGVNPIELCSNGKCTYEKEYEVPTAGEYNIWTEDNVGNISVNPKNKISVNNVDNTQPSCSIEFEGKEGEHGWRTEEVIPKMTTSQAGISGLYFGLSKGTTKSYSSYVGSGEIGSAQKAKQSDTTGQKYTCAVKSLAGKTNSSEATIKVDTVKPLISKVAVASKNNNYHTNTVTLTIDASDLTSGVKKMCLLTSNNFNDCNSKWIDYKKTTDQKTGFDYSTGGKITFYIWVKDEAGLVSDMKNTPEYTVYQSCSVAANIVNNGNYTCGTDYSTCSDACGGTQRATKTQLKKDKYTQAACDSDIEPNSSSCEKTCGGKAQQTCTAYSAYSTCTNACGGGTQTKTRTCTVMSKDGSKVCSTKQESKDRTCGGVSTTETCTDPVAQTTCSDACGGTYKTKKTCTKKSTDGTKICKTREVEKTVNCGGISTTETCTDPVAQTTCSNACGGTYKTKKTCTKKSTDGTKICKTRNVEETVNCGGVSTTETCTDPVAKSTCSNACGGTYKTTKTCTKKSTDGSKVCKTRDVEETVNCGGKLPESCTTSDYGSCTDSCGGTKSKTKTCKTMATDNKTQCGKTSTSKVETTNCGGKKAEYGTCKAKSGAKCSKTCGGGTKAGTKTGKYVSTVDGKTCSSAHGTPAAENCNIACNTQSCCSASNPSACPVRYVCDYTGTYLHVKDEHADYQTGDIVVNGGDKVYLLDTNGKFYKISYNKKVYYVRDKCINKTGANCDTKCPG